MVIAEPWIVRLTPEPFRDFLPYTSASALEVIHVTRVLSKAVSVARHYHDERARAVAARQLREWLRLDESNRGLTILDAAPNRLDPAALDEETRAIIGERVLTLYFQLLRWEGPLFLDLRLRNFAWDAKSRELGFYPTSLWYQPGKEFSGRVRDLYSGFYSNDPGSLQRGIELYAWESRPSPGFAARIERLLREHFGEGGGDVRFAIPHFKSTFDRIFREAADSGAKLHPELTLLGVKLVGLYLTLEALAVPLNPRRVFERVCQR